MIKDNIERVRRRIAEICEKHKIPAGKVTILAVTKGRSIAQIQEVVTAGVNQLGENRLQEAAEKYREVSGAHWQMVGHLQSNKIKDALQIFDLIHSVDTLKLAQGIDRQAQQIGKIQDILLEVKTSPEPAKFGLAPQDLSKVAEEIGKFRNLNIKGLMTIAPAVSEAEGARPFFAQLKALRDRLNPAWLLSMGMSDDFEVAIEEGADIVRLGRIIFQEHV
jgi:PLP dependent protein